MQRLVIRVWIWCELRHVRLGAVVVVHLVDIQRPTARIVVKSWIGLADMRPLVQPLAGRHTTYRVAGALRI